MNQSGSEKNGTISTQTTLRKRKTEKIPLDTKAGAGSYKMKEKHIVDEIEPTASSILSKEVRTAISKPIKEVDPLCSIHDVDLRNLLEEHDLGFRKNLSGKAGFVLDGPP